MTNKLLAIDIGNSRISCALFKNGEVSCVEHFSSTNPSADDIAQIISLSEDADVALSSVVPSNSLLIEKALQAKKKSYFNIAAARNSIISGTYATFGTDRLANAVAALKLHGQDADVIVMDFGTATTLTAVSGKKEFKGGLITLGLTETLKALSANTAQLPEIELRKNKYNALSFETAGAIETGTVLAHLGLVSQWLKFAKSILGTNVKTIATGGLAETLCKLSNDFDIVDPLLTLRGIYFIAVEAMDLTDRR